MQTLLKVQLPSRSRHREPEKLKKDRNVACNRIANTIDINWDEILSVFQGQSNRYSICSEFSISHSTKSESIVICVSVFYIYDSLFHHL